MKYWILIADASRARLLSTTGLHGPLQVEKELDNPLGRAREQDLVSDEPGRYRKGAGALSAMEPDTSAHEVQAQDFARRLAGMLGKELASNVREKAAVMAPPHFLGLIRKSMDGHLGQRILAWVEKDLTPIASHDLASHLVDAIVPGAFLEMA